LELWKLNTIFKLFLLSVTVGFLVSAFLHQIFILHLLPIILAIGASSYVAVIIEPVLHQKEFRTYLISMILLTIGLVSTIATVGYAATVTLNNSCPSSTGLVLDWSGTLNFDAERHPYLNTGTSYIIRFESLSGPGYNYLISRDPLPTPVLHRGSLTVLNNTDVWTFTPSDCGKYWIELRIPVLGQSTDYHVTVTSVP
jgi:hypothetical protein